jgi:hypothetical protein
VTDQTPKDIVPSPVRAIANSIAARAHRAILTAHERFAKGEDFVEWVYAGLKGAAKMHASGDPNDREHVRATHAEYASVMALAHYNGAVQGILALIEHAEQMEQREQDARTVELAAASTPKPDPEGAAP